MRGYPSRIDTTVDRLRLTKSWGCFRLAGAFFQLFASELSAERGVIAVWPAEQILTIAGLPVRCERRTLRARPAWALPPPALPGSGDCGIGAAASAGRKRPGMAGADRLLAAARRAAGAEASYDLYLEASVVTLPAPLRQAVDPAGPCPMPCKACASMGTVTLDRPLDRQLADRVSVRALDLRDAALVWGPVQIGLLGEVQVDANGVPDGALTLRLTDWRSALAMAATLGLVPQGSAPALTALGETLSAGDEEQAGSADHLREGKWNWGPVPLGPAPRFALGRRRHGGPSPWRRAATGRRARLPPTQMRALARSAS